MPKIIHIAGSKGKGTTAHVLAEILRLNGQRVGLFTSPAVYEREEMIQVNGVPIEREDLNAILSRLPEEHSEFEKLTLAAFEFFEQENCDFWILECGWGGKIDSTNWVERKDLCLLTHVELEHTEVLGSTLSDIALEQLGIRPAGVPLISVATQNEDVWAVMEDFEVAEPVKMAHFHPESVGLAVAAARHFGFEAEVENLQIPGRFEVHRSPERTLIFDGAHTVDSVKFLMEEVERFRAAEGLPEPTWLVHILSDKNPAILEIFPKDRTFWVELPEEPRAGKNLRDFPVFEGNLPEGLVVVTGSFKIDFFKRRE